ncbi:hypothetical protein [Streptomyces sp. NPDC048665]|uniref:hypothetical protein n=1 Tax=Streptomyces sp. NPDC048665 TaxID=3155490 RepID=UPI003435195A
MGAAAYFMRLHFTLFATAARAEIPALVAELRDSKGSEGIVGVLSQELGMKHLDAMALAALCGRSHPCATKTVSSAVNSPHLAVVAGRVWSDPLVP